MCIRKRFVFLLVLPMFLTSCDSKENLAQTKAPNPSEYNFQYNLKKPTKTNFLDQKLIEISGLSQTPDSTKLVCINDEQGRIFYVDKFSGKLESSFEFGTSGDYEGLEFVNGKCYVVKNNGTLYIIDPKTKNVIIENTFLTQSNNVEGLAYWPPKNRLLLACKGSPSGKNNYKKSKAIYDFDLTEMKLKKKPMLLISIEAIKDYFVGRKNTGGITGKFLKTSLLNDALSFAPSGIAVHPKTQHIYILSARGNTLFIIDEKGEILHIEFLSKTKFVKPEGITFDEDGTLYIANEGKNAKATIHKFSFKH